MSTAAPRLSRRALFGLGGAALTVAGAATVWRLRSSSAEAATLSRTDAPILYADHDGWMVSIAEKQALHTLPADPAGPGR